MRRIIVVLCLAGLTALACGPATPAPVAEGEPVQGAGEPEPGLSAGESGLQQRPVEPIGGEPGLQPTEQVPSGGGQDQDFDGILDPSDRCADMPEDRDGFQDEDGCPDPDNDQDGLSDIQDMCPTEPEDMDGVQDEDGCPDP